MAFVAVHQRLTPSGCLFFQHKTAAAPCPPHHAHARHGLCTTAFSAIFAGGSCPWPWCVGASTNTAVSTLNFFEQHRRQREVVQLSKALHNFLWIKTGGKLQKHVGFQLYQTEKHFSDAPSTGNEVCRFSACCKAALLEKLRFFCGYGALIRPSRGLLY